MEFWLGSGKAYNILFLAVRACLELSLVLIVWGEKGQSYMGLQGLPKDCRRIDEILGKKQQLRTPGLKINIGINKKCGSTKGSKDEKS